MAPPAGFLKTKSLQPDSVSDARQLLGMKGASGTKNIWKLRLQLMKPVTWIPLIMSWQREADGGSTDNYMVYLAELLLGRGAVANGHVYRCKGPDCPACRVDVNAHPGGARGWSFGE